jgi:hypothetical protein
LNIKVLRPKFIAVRRRLANKRPIQPITIDYQIFKLSKGSFEVQFNGWNFDQLNRAGCESGPKNDKKDIKALKSYCHF